MKGKESSFVVVKRGKRREDVKSWNEGQCSTRRKTTKKEEEESDEKRRTKRRTKQIDEVVQEEELRRGKVR